MKGLQCFGAKGKLAQGYIGPYQIIEQKGSVTYKLALSDQLAAVHDVFHVSQLMKYLKVPQKVIDESDIELASDLSYEGKPIIIFG